jgi:hypothetical protein
MTALEQSVKLIRQLLDMEGVEPIDKLVWLMLLLDADASNEDIAKKVGITAKRVRRARALADAHTEGKGESC